MEYFNMFQYVLTHSASTSMIRISSLAHCKNSDHIGIIRPNLAVYVKFCFILAQTGANGKLSEMKIQYCWVKPRKLAGYIYTYSQTLI